MIPRSNPLFYFDASVKPVRRVRPGDTVIVETERADSMYIRTPEDTFSDMSDMLLKQGGGTNPCTGPIFIEGAKPGDKLSVEILDVKPAAEGYTCIYPGAGALASTAMKPSLQHPLPPLTTVCTIKKDTIFLPLNHKTVEIPVHPFIGTIATAPVNQRIATFFNGQEFLGNVDCPLIGPQHTLVLPVNVEGGLLFVGDVHAAQGHGEISGTAIECRAEVTLKLSLLKGDEAEYVAWPQVHNREQIGSIACLPTSLEDALNAAYVDMILRMEAHGIDRYDAYQLITQVGEVLVCQSIAPLYSCVVSIKRRYLE
jgi:acetamidase/formamidase